MHGWLHTVELRLQTIAATLGLLAWATWLLLAEEQVHAQLHSQLQMLAETLLLLQLHSLSLIHKLQHYLLQLLITKRSATVLVMLLNWQHGWLATVVL